MNTKTICLILGGGAGTRLHPLTKDRSKPAVPIAGKYRLIDIPISNCLHSGLKQIFVLTQYNSASLNQHIKNTYYFDAFGNGFVEILAAEQTPSNQNWFEGTADAVRQSLHHLQNYNYDNLLILSGDQLYQMDFSKLLAQHQKSGAELTIATKPVTAQDATSFGIMKVDHQSAVTSFIEKPSLTRLDAWKSDVDVTLKMEGKHFLASMGIYVFNQKAINRLFFEKPMATDFGKEIIPHAIQSDYRVNSYAFDGYWTDIGTIRSFFHANIALAKNQPAFDLFAQHSIFTRPRMLAPSQISDTHLSQSLIAEGSIIHAKKIQQSVVGIRSRIGQQTRIIRSIIFGNDFVESPNGFVDIDGAIPMGIGKNCVIENAIIDKNCRIGNNVSIIGDLSLEPTKQKDYCIVDGIIVLKKGACIPDNTIIGLQPDQPLKIPGKVLVEQIG